MEPRLVYTGVTNASQDDNPLFVPAAAQPQERIRQFELFNLTRNPSDRIDSVNAITAGLGNRFYVPGEEGEPPQLFADVSLSTQYDFASDDNSQVLRGGDGLPLRERPGALQHGLGLQGDRVQRGPPRGQILDRGGTRPRLQLSLPARHSALLRVLQLQRGGEPLRGVRGRACSRSTSSPSGGGWPSTGTGPSATGFATPSRARSS